VQGRQGIEGTGKLSSRYPSATSNDFDSKLKFAGN